ncbi:unnamed protein product [Rotaria sordida]|uniref:Dynein light chain roadblock n=1 Tax=Rotaria sordida TaxID=392033 RepID=A0A814LYY5_9BILA|nr:unnamed protein product [Rotaria sordida]CAF1047004.1 unnamed protein product [Rotaria sordida]CAF1054253.1 unnamed protein product [Rotaria sordida]CAF1070341.1 unnamed protein product [Rotaria sordida]CAF1195421.1 unnamed protein product [Rotaria sordida]
MSSAPTLASSQQAEIEETIKRIQTHKGVQGFILTSNDGSFVRSTIDNSTTMSLTGLIRTLSDKAKSCVRDLDPQNDLTFLRIRTKKQEILVAPDKDYLTIVLQANEQT